METKTPRTPGDISDFDLAHELDHLANDSENPEATRATIRELLFRSFFALGKADFWQGVRHAKRRDILAYVLSHLRKDNQIDLTNHGHSLGSISAKEPRPFIFAAEPPAVGFSVGFLEPSGVERRVAFDMAERQQQGISRYGVSVESSPLHPRDWVQHAYEESLDLPIYLRKLLDGPLPGDPQPAASENGDTNGSDLTAEELDARLVELAIGYPISIDTLRALQRPDALMRDTFGPAIQIPTRREFLADLEAKLLTRFPHAAP